MKIKTWETKSTFVSGQKQRAAADSPEQDRPDVERPIKVSPRNGRNRTRRQQTFRISHPTFRVSGKHRRRKDDDRRRRQRRQVEAVGDLDVVQSSFALEVGRPQGRAQSWSRRNETPW